MSLWVCHVCSTSPIKVPITNDFSVHHCIVLNSSYNRLGRNADEADAEEIIEWPVKPLLLINKSKKTSMLRLNVSIHCKNAYVGLCWISLVGSISSLALFQLKPNK